eukprot:gene22472-24474_t
MRVAAAFVVALAGLCSRPYPTAHTLGTDAAGGGQCGGGGVPNWTAGMIGCCAAACGAACGALAPSGGGCPKKEERWVPEERRGLRPVVGARRELWGLRGGAAGRLPQEERRVPQEQRWVPEEQQG